MLTKATTDTGATQDMVGKALTLLTLLGEHPHGAAASVLARESGFPLSTAHRLLRTLVRDGFAKFDHTTRQYAVGIRIFELAQSVSVAYGFAGMTRPILEALSAITQEATLLTVRDNDRQLYVQTIAGPQQVSVTGDPGQHGPLHCTAVGKVLTAFAADDVREKLISSLTLDPCSPNTITDRTAFRAEIEKVRQLGYAVADEEHELGIRAIAVPVFVHGEVVASVATAAPAYRATVSRLEEYVPHLHDTARSLATVMALR